MTDTDSGLLEFLVIAEETCDCGKREMRDILLRIFLDNDIRKRLDLSSEFFTQFGKQNPAVRKQVGLYEFENIEHGIICAICVNPKEYLELYGILFEANKKHKGVKRGTKGMDFDKYASRILTPEDAREGTNRFAKKQKQTRFKNHKGNMIMESIEKCELGQLMTRGTFFQMVFLPSLMDTFISRTLKILNLKVSVTFPLKKVFSIMKII